MRPHCPFALAAAGVMAAAPAAAELDLCYDGVPPSDAVEATQEQRVQANRIMMNGFHTTPILFRRLCGLSDGRDADYLREVDAALGCSPDSDVGKAHEELVSGDLAAIGGYAGFSDTVAEHPEFKDKFCAHVAALPWPLIGTDLSMPAEDVLDTYRRTLDDAYAVLDRYRVPELGE